MCSPGKGTPAFATQFASEVSQTVESCQSELQLKNDCVCATGFQCCGSALLVISSNLVLNSAATGFPYEVLAAGHYVPGEHRCELPRYKGKDVWPKVMHIDGETSMRYFERVHGDFCRAVTKGFTSKEKAGGTRLRVCQGIVQNIRLFSLPCPWQKNAQLDLDAHQALMDCTCLYFYIRPLLKDTVSHEIMVMIDQMWLNGWLGLN